MWKNQRLISLFENNLKRKHVTLSDIKKIKLIKKDSSTTDISIIVTIKKILTDIGGFRAPIHGKTLNTNK